MSRFDYIYIGPVPANEPCVQTTDPDYSVKGYAECERFRDLLKQAYRDNHGGRECPARIVVKGESHDFGTYYEVACKYDETDPAQVEAAFWLDEHAPTEWPE